MVIIVSKNKYWPGIKLKFTPSKLLFWSASQERGAGKSPQTKETSRNRKQLWTDKPFTLSCPVYFSFLTLCKYKHTKMCLISPVLVGNNAKLLFFAARWEAFLSQALLRCPLRTKRCTLTLQNIVCVKSFSGFVIATFASQVWTSAEPVPTCMTTLSTKPRLLFPLQQTANRRRRRKPPHGDQWRVRHTAYGAKIEELEETHYVVDRRGRWKAAKSDSLTEEENLIKSKGGCWKCTSYDFFSFLQLQASPLSQEDPTSAPGATKRYILVSTYMSVRTGRQEFISGGHFFTVCVCVCLQLRRCRLSGRTGTGPACAARGVARLWLPAATQRWETEPRWGKWWCFTLERLLKEKHEHKAQLVLPIQNRKLQCSPW